MASKKAEYTKDDLERLSQKQSESKSKNKWTLNLLIGCLAAGTGTLQFGYNLSSLNSATTPVQTFIRKHAYIFKETNVSLANDTEYNLVDDNNLVPQFTTDIVSVSENQVAMDIEQTLNLVWTLLNCIFVLGQFLGGFSSKYALEYIGRKNAFIFHNTFCVLGSAFVFIAKCLKSPVCLIISRFFFGVQGGFSISLTPIYISEIAPNSLRGAAGSFSQILISVGIVFAQILGFKEIFGNEKYWHFLLGFPIIPGIFGCLVFLLYLPESPKALLIKNKDYDEAKNALKIFRNRNDVKDELDAIYQETLQSQKPISFKELVTSKDLRWPLITTVTLFFGLQVSGINAIFFYSTSIFKEAGISPNHIQYVILLTGLINIPANIACMPLIEKFGRRILVLSTTFLIVVNYFILTTLLTFQKLHWIMPLASIVCILIFIVLFALAIGPIPGIYATEVFAQNTRSTAMAFTGMVGCIAFLFVAFIFPVLQPIINQYVFLVFAALISVVFSILFIKMPETKGKSVDEIVALFKQD